jgi:isoamylase
MLLMGDEVRRTQRGNNNAYCQDNLVSWFDWQDVDRHADVRRFVRGLIRFHQSSAIFRDRGFWGEPGATKITWHGVELDRPQWDDDSHSLAYELASPDGSEHLHVMLNAYWKPLTFALPPVAKGRTWRRLVDTSLVPPRDFTLTAEAISNGARYICQARSSVVLVDLASADRPG